MKILIVAADSHHAKSIRAQYPPKSATPLVTYPGQVDHLRGQRFDLVLVTDYYKRVLHYEMPHKQLDAKIWFKDCVAARLAVKGQIIFL